MKPKQLAQELKISDVEVLRLAIQAGIVGASFKTVFSSKQINDIKEFFANSSVRQLAPAPEQAPEAPLEKVEGFIEQAPEAFLEEGEKGIAEVRQTAFSNAMAASENQEAHIIETELQQVADDGLHTGVVKELLRATKEREGAMLVRDAVYKSGQASRERLKNLLADSTNDDFLSASQHSSQTYAQTAETGATTTTDTYQALRNLGIKLQVKRF